MASLSTGQIEDYRRDGFLFPIEVFSPTEVDEFRTAFESLIESSRDYSLNRFDRLHHFFDWAYRLVIHPALLDVVESILGDDILVYGTLVFAKQPHDLRYASWHQDSFYSGLHLTPSTTAWIALTPSHQQNGCMRVIPGSHKLGPIEHETVADSNLLNRRGERIKIEVDESEAVDVVLRPGEISLHESTLVHGSTPNSSDDARIGFIVRFVTSRMQNPNTRLMRVRGDGDCSHLDLAEKPSLNSEEALKAWLAFSCV
ncbi:MAG TPA: phytanoyl-CoA dioxygenase family protein [Pyrinomonadaceae bacterium]|nr:phytanoyl-CoA dioxygenase family protein [Pyrinomonadaceae bacterium]